MQGVRRLRTLGPMLDVVRKLNRLTRSEVCNVGVRLRDERRRARRAEALERVAVVCDVARVALAAQAARQCPEQRCLAASWRPQQQRQAGLQQRRLKSGVGNECREATTLPMAVPYLPETCSGLDGHRGTRHEVGQMHSLPS